MSVFEAIRDHVSLADEARRYTSLERAGSRLRGRCPLPGHDDSTPSFYVFDDEHFYCFGCRGWGDVVDLRAKIGRLSNIEAALELARENNVPLPDRDPEAQRKAEGRRQREAGFFEQAKSYHALLSGQPRAAEWWERRGFGAEARERFLLGASPDGTAAVVPFWHRGRVLGLVRRQLDREPKYLLPKAEEFHDGYKPLFVVGPQGGDIYLVEGYVDALALAALDLRAVAVGGTGISERQKAELLKLKGAIYIYPDADDEGAKAAREWAVDFYPSARLCPAEYGEGHKDVADLFAAEGGGAKAILDRLKSRAVDALDLALSDAPKGSTRERYRYTKEHAVPLLLKLEDEGERAAAVEDAAQVLKIKVGEIRKLLKAEHPNAEAEPPPGEDVPQPGTERYERAVELLSQPDLLGRAAADMERLGYVGEYRTKQLALVCALSARAGNPIQPSTHAQSSSGKNALWDTTLSLLPPEMVVSRSALSSKALYRTEANLKGGVLYIQEMAGSEDAEYTIRVMQSGNCLEYEATEKTPDGQMRNVVHRVEGPTVIVQTTTKNHLHPENETRVFSIYIDESEQQTRLIVRSVLAEAAGGGIARADREAILQVWRDAVRLLEPGEVVIPFAGRIEMPTGFVRIRRDARRLINVVRVVAWLHQHRRERDSGGRILATEGDFETSLQLVGESLRRAWQSLTPSEQRVLEAIQKLPELKLTQGFKRRDLRVSGISDRRMKEILKSLVDSGYLDCDFGTGPKGFTFTLARSADEVGLGIRLRPSPDEGQPFTGEEDGSGGGSSPDLRPIEAEHPSGGDGLNGHRPMYPLDSQDLCATGRSGGVEFAEMSDAAEPDDSEEAFAVCEQFFSEAARAKDTPMQITPADEYGL